MELSRAMLSASLSVLGILLYITAALLTVLAGMTALRQDANGAPSFVIGAAAAAFTAAGLVCRFLSRKIA